MDPMIGKRKKRKVECANPLFVQWLTEWKEEAVDNGWKTHFTYNKALNTLKKFPLALSCGKDCRMLQNFGDKICKMLDDRLAKHVDTYGTTAPVVETDSISTSISAAGQSCHTTSSMSGNLESVNRVHTIPRIDSGIISDQSDDEQPTQHRKRRTSSGNKVAREYIPAYRSGPYSILLALLRNAQNPNSLRDFMTRTELIEAAQPLADKSFTAPDPGCRYTAWSSMGTLIKKGLVIKNSSPARYSLTDSGNELARRLENVDESSLNTSGRNRGAVPSTTNSLVKSTNNSQDKSTNVDVKFTNSGQAKSSNIDVKFTNSGQAKSSNSVVKSRTDIEPLRNYCDSLPHLPLLDLPQHNSDKDEELHAFLQKDRLQYWFVTDDNRLVKNKDDAAVSIDEDNCVSFLIQCNYQSLLGSGKTYKLDTSRPLSDDVYAYLCDADADDVAVPPSAKPSQKQDITNPPAKTKPQKHQKKTIHTATVPPDNEVSLRERLLGSRMVTNDSVLPVSDTLSSLTASNSDTGTFLTNSALSVQSKRGDALSSLTASASNTDTFVTNSQESTASDKSCPSQNSVVSSASTSSNLPPADFVFTPDSFDIILLVDNREFYGGGKTNSKTLLPDLIRNGVECDLRPLHVGDMLWIAREKSQNLPDTKVKCLVLGQIRKPQGRELVLDYIIERKRMDDLVSSTIDGRFREQKFRLKRCGVRNAIYLIEEYGSMQHFSISEDKLKQAITNTQVIDGFQIKTTHGVKETVTYLTVLTRYLQSYYRGKTLHACSLEMLQEMKGSFPLHEQEQILVEFQHFNQGSVKSKNLTVREMFGKQLIQLHGMSADKAKAIVDHYPTVMHLYDAYISCHSDKERESLIANVKVGKLGRNLGIGQSRQISQLYWTNSALT